MDNSKSPPTLIPNLRENKSPPTLISKLKGDEEEENETDEQEDEDASTVANENLVKTWPPMLTWLPN